MLSWSREGHRPSGLRSQDPDRVDIVGRDPHEILGDPHGSTSGGRSEDFLHPIGGWIDRNEQDLCSANPDYAAASRNISTAARHALSASSSWAAGTPNTAITASPMNFSTEPSCASTIALIRSK